MCNTYLDFARVHPQRYRIMFGGLWTPSVDDTSITDADLDALGAEALTLLADVLVRAWQGGSRTAVTICTATRSRCGWDCTVLRTNVPWCARCQDRPTSGSA